MAAPVSPTDPQFITKTFWDTEIYARWTDVYAGWTTYTPTWTATSVNPVIGNGSLGGAYKRPDGSKSVYVRIRLLPGSSTTFGTGTWAFTLPSGLVPTNLQTLAGYIHDASPTVARYPISAYLSSSAGVERIAVSSGTGVAATVPFTWAINDILLLTGVYEIS